MTIIKTTEIRYTIPDAYTCIATDDPSAKTVTVRIKESPYYPSVVLWSGDEYDKAGIWTTEQVAAAMAAYLKKQTQA